MILNSSLDNICINAKYSLVVFLFLFITSTRANPTKLPNTAISQHSLDDTSLLWGPYRPNLYFGLRPRIPDTVLVGLMWSNANNPDVFRKNLRHTCEQNEGMTGYGWTSYDPRSGGSHVVRDAVNQINLEVDFSKFSDGDELGWAMKVRGNVQPHDHETQKTSLILYISTESEDSFIDCAYSPERTESQPNITCSGNLSSLPNFRMDILPKIKQKSGQQNLEHTSVHSVQTEKGESWQAKSRYLSLLKTVGEDNVALPNNTKTGNMVFSQATFMGDFDMDISFRSLLLTETGATESASSNKHGQNATITFENRFRKVYQPLNPFSNTEYATFSKELLSNLMGGIGFFHGKSKVNSNASAEQAHIKSTNADMEERGPYSLFSAVPSRPFFPRGFLWDEGFHLQLIIDWDMDLALDIVTSWFDLMDDNGWIAREQILGLEARSKVPTEFQTQYQIYANPPTLFLVLDMFIDRSLGNTPYHGAPSRYAEKSSYTAAAKSRENAKQFLAEIYPKMRKHYLWFRKTQSGSLEKYQYAHSTEEGALSEGYRWRGRTTDHILTSGLDDYPRTSTPSTDELHLDALCWVSLMAQVLSKVSKVLPSVDIPHRQQYDLQALEMSRTAAKVHWSEADQAYCDLTIISGKIEHVCHKGYVSLLPLLTDTISDTEGDDDRIAAVLDLISSPSHLWTSYGIRSLSAQDPAYGTGEDYWRSPIWVNFNYLILESLLKLALNPQSPQAERAKSIYIELRTNIVNTVFNSWRETGFAWEQYNADTGAGQRTQHFTGWTALIVRIMAMPDLSETAQRPSQQNEPFPGLHQPLASGPRANFLTSNYSVLVLMISIILFAGVFFRRRLMRIWRTWLDDR